MSGPGKHGLPPKPISGRAVPPRLEPGVAFLLRLGVPLVAGSILIGVIARAVESSGTWGQRWYHASCVGKALPLWLQVPLAMAFMGGLALLWWAALRSRDGNGDRRRVRHRHRHP